MQTFKTIDYYIQLILLAGSCLVVTGMLLASKHDLTDFIIFYLLMGSWQLLSAVIHLFYRPPYKTFLRKIYLSALAIVIILLAISCNMEEYIFLYLYMLLLVSPLMTIYYLIICRHENRQLKNRVRKQ